MSALNTTEILQSQVENMGKTALKSGMSKKAAIVGFIAPAIASSSDWKTQAFLAGLGGVAILVQGVLDYRQS